ncbi:MAG: hypothetical protein R3D00_08700 [Bacteroidia bacterium]
MENTTKKTYIALHTWVIFSLLSAPGLSLASQLYEPDTAYVLAINHLKPVKKNSWQTTTRFSYISAGARVNLTLEDGQEITNAQIEAIGKGYIVVAGNHVPITSIAKIKVIDSPERNSQKILGSLLILAGISLMVYGMWLGLFVSFYNVISLIISGEEDTFSIGLLMLLGIGMTISGVVMVSGRVSEFNLGKHRYTLSTAAISDLSPKVREKLVEEFFW